MDKEKEQNKKIFNESKTIEMDTTGGSQLCALAVICAVAGFPARNNTIR